ncbi:hypothetical protein ILUMI_04762 [Ignelater luminosus]|uniref:Reverse transcriptase domain-containing protein n=1 Tax=Ignelater luminosus TaxID=2038154 RepID=A0A8K0GH14_IGNLU|nr:hypothetical protein ILUMI_04762 [Ignelater luminosus]
MAVLCNLTEAFDCAPHQILIPKLQYYKFDDKSISLITSYLSGREQIVEFNNVKSSLLPIEHGVPQGSVLGPILFLIYFNDIATVLTNCCKLTLFADDTTISVSDTDPLGVYDKSKQALNRAKFLFDLNKLALNGNKT